MTRVLFRPQRGGYTESMAQQIWVADKLALAVVLDCDVTQISLRWYCLDTRNKWDTWLVSVDGRAVGFTNGEL